MIYETCPVCEGMGVIFDARRANDDVACPNPSCVNGTTSRVVPDQPKRKGD